MNKPSSPEKRLRFRIRLLLAERDLSVADLYKRVQQQGFAISSSHFFRQMQPYPSTLRPALLAEICKAIGCDASELLELVELAGDAGGSDVSPRAVTPSRNRKVAKPSNDTDEIRRARQQAQDKRRAALLGPKVTVIGFREKP